ncbi:MAG TPA: hypothetical protein VIJ28_06540 [Chloroflexota bacterium]|jgi:hypothetical protein
MPGFEQAGQRQAGGTAGRGAGASADFALDHDRARQALGAVIVGVEAVDPHKGEEFAHVAQQAFGQRLAEFDPAPRCR